MSKFTDFRQHIPVTKEWAYLETASTGLIPDYVHDGIQRYQEDRFLKGGDSVWKYGNENVSTLEIIEKSKDSIAEMIHSTKDRIAFGQSATQMFAMVTEGIDYCSNDNVVTVDKGWIGNRYAWQKRESDGLEVRYVQPLDGIISAEMVIGSCDDNTRAVTVNLVESFNGYRIDIDSLGKFCKENDILLFVDAVQALGVLDVDVKRTNIDFMVGNDYKWMMNYCGTGYAYISNKVQNLIKHWGAGWMSDSDRFDVSKERLDLRDDAGRFEIGYPHIDGIYGVGMAAEHYNSMGRKEIEKYVCGLADYFRKRVETTEGISLKYDFPQENRCQIVYAIVGNSVNIDDKDFKDAKVFAHFSNTNEKAGRGIRVSFHYYNNEEDIDRFFKVIEGGRK